MIFELLNASPELQSLLGSPVRAYPFGEAPQGVEYPYVTWQGYAGNPLNYLADRPDMDRHVTQFDVWSRLSDQCIEVAKTVRYVIETECYVTAYNPNLRDPETMSYRVSFDAVWHDER